MNIGLLWFDNDPKRPLTTKVQQAAARYAAKFDERATVCYVNPADLDGVNEVDGVQLKVATNVLRWHLWIEAE